MNNIYDLLFYYTPTIVVVTDEWTIYTSFMCN